MTFLLLSLFIVGASAQNCDGTGTQFYKTLGCTPVLDTALTCPIGFNCPQYQTSSTYCNFNGLKYNIGQSIDQSLISGNCLEQCTCELPQNSNIAQFTCKVTPCTDSVLPNSGKCHLTYSLDKCCSDGVSCSKTVTCVSGNKKLFGGQKYIDNSTCMQCICGGGCQNAQCTFEINPLQPNNPTHITNFCAPLYTSGNLCCPDDFICPSSNDKIEITDMPTPSVTLPCKYGSQNITALQMVKTNFKNAPVKCYCKYGPYLTCQTVSSK